MLAAYPHSSVILTVTASGLSVPTLLLSPGFICDVSVSATKGILQMSRTVMTKREITLQHVFSRILLMQMMMEITYLLSKGIWEIKSQTEHHISIWFLLVFILIDQKI